MMNEQETIIFFFFLLVFALFVILDMVTNLKKTIRNQQFFMPFVALGYSVLLFLFFEKLGDYLVTLCNRIPMEHISEPVANAMRQFLGIDPVYLSFILFNLAALVAFLFIKNAALIFFRSKNAGKKIDNAFVSIFYEYHNETDLWYIKPFFRQAKTFLKVAFFATSVITATIMFVSFYFYGIDGIKVPYYPVFSILLIGEVVFFLDGNIYNEKNDLSVDTDHSRHITNYVVLRKKFSDIFGDKLSSDGTTVNDNMARGLSIDQVLCNIEREYGHDGQNYADYIRKKIKEGALLSADYLCSGIELTKGKSLLFNTPFYYKLSPYLFYAMNSALIKGGNVLIVLGRHGTSEDIVQWCRDGLFKATNIPDLWDIGVLDKTEKKCSIGIVTRSGVHDLEIHKANQSFLNEVSFVVLIEPSRLITTAQIGLNLLVQSINTENDIVFCSMDQNCDGLVDALSHVLMTNIVEVSATEYPQGISSYMCWLADNDYLQHRLTPGISRYLGMGTELSVVGFKNQIEQAIWYGGDAFPVLDAHWIAKQYYHDLLSLTNYPITQETFDSIFKVSYNLSNEQVRKNSFVVVEDEFNNLFEVKRELSTMSLEQGFVNVISTEYMLREYMAKNEKIFNTDPKAIPLIAADYARTARNICLRICLQMSMFGISKDALTKEFMLIQSDPNEKNLANAVWKEICRMFLGENGGTTISVQTDNSIKIFSADTILLKREFSTETGRFEDIYFITDKDFIHTVIDDLQSAKYITEKGNESICLGTELKGHILQKYLPGQFFTLNGKYYEMLFITSNNQVMVRRASDHINGRPSYRQIRRYQIDYSHDDNEMGMLKNVNGVRIYHQFADFSVSTPAYWKLNAYNDFKNASKVIINDVPVRRYLNKQILKLDFSDFGDAFTDKIRITLTLLINEVFKTLFADNCAYIVAVTAGEYEKPLTYSLDGAAVFDRCIYIIEDSQLDIGLLVAVERNFERIMHIISDYLDWDKKCEETNDQSKNISSEEALSENFPSVDASSETEQAENMQSAEDSSTLKKNKKKSLWQTIKEFFSRKSNLTKAEEVENKEELPEEQEIIEQPIDSDDKSGFSDIVLANEDSFNSEADSKEMFKDEQIISDDELTSDNAAEQSQGEDDKSDVSGY